MKIEVESVGPYFKHDFRYNHQIKTLLALDDLISSFRDQVGDGYDGLSFIEDAESIYGLGLISLQNYINKSIKDYCYSFENKSKKDYFYKKGKVITGYNNTNIELINALANYAKHGQEAIRPTTQMMLKNFGIQVFDEYDFKDESCSEICDIDKANDLEYSPINLGIPLLTNNSQLVSIFQDVKKWRDDLWK